MSHEHLFPEPPLFNHVKPMHEAESLEILIDVLPAIEILVEQIADEPALVRWSRRISYQDKPRLAPELRRQFIKLARQMDQLRDAYSLRYFPLHTDIFLQCVDISFPYGIANQYSNDLKNRIADCIYEIHLSMRHPDMKEELRVIERKHKRQKDKVKYLLDGLFDHYSRLLVHRIDLGYQSSHVPNLEQVQDDLERFLRYLREQHGQQGEAFVGYIWKLEYGLMKGWHLHLLVILDGRLVLQDITHARMMCDHWIKHITQGVGVAYNCNAKKEEYRRCGIGMVQRHDRIMQDDVYQAALYLTKPDLLCIAARENEAAKAQKAGYHELAKCLEKVRQFGTSQLPKYTMIPRGRPRD